MSRPAVFVFGQTGCPACEDYIPRFQRLAGGAACPIGVYDLAKDPKANEFATRLGVNATPTTVVMNSRGQLLKKVGAIADREIQKLLRLALG